MKRVGDTDISTLVTAAAKARESSYCPYSHFAVGAALLSADGKIYTGANIENASYPLSLCAERAAFAAAVCAGEGSFEAIAVCGWPQGGTSGDELCMPCGACRQVMREFCGDDFKIIACRSQSEYKVFTLGAILPESFGRGNLGGEKGGRKQ